ncbi:Dual specificity protein phosphatase 1 isoform 1 [Dorcoceras hygrometricum]|uniref:Dual specificity protein phosphatase 1 isoform 1 n=1 Tax=Dorcoceras hygrometricum TaxID=472368 RepID=A0A2Z7BFQ7_9LAMI|nr:Dual specificity protein phosphatase 1 isoform 1 [Dorcoceras hygrometricum]
MQALKVVREDNVPCEVEEGLYLGSLGAANNKIALKSLNITHVLTVASSLSPAHPNDFVYKTIPAVLDKADVLISQYFDECFAFIEEARTTGGGVLVHCFAGRSRSVTVVVAYLMFKNGMPLSEALEHVKIVRQVASPNLGFMSQLHMFERSLQGVNTESANQV